MKILTTIYQNIRNTFIIHILTLRGKVNCKNTAGITQDTVSTPYFHRRYIFRSKKRSDHCLHRNFVPTNNYSFIIYITSCRKGLFILHQQKNFKPQTRFKPYDNQGLRSILNFNKMLIKYITLIHDEDKMLKIKYMKQL